MPFVQFRIHPGIGCARFGNSTAAYHLASEFPYFMQEEFPSLRFQPIPRVHPAKFFTTPQDRSASAAAAGFSIFDSTPALQKVFKETEGVVFPQAARFRVFAYVYARGDSPLPKKVFEVTPQHADITWTVTLGNKKSVRTKTAPDPAIALADPFESVATDTLDTAVATLECRRLKPFAKLPNLGYLFLERDEADPTKVNGRLHVIGNEGDLEGTDPVPSGVLWADDWYDSAADGPVQASVRPKAALRAAVGAASTNDLKFLNYGADDTPIAGNSASVDALPAWAVVGPPDYVPDMGHFVSLWDIAYDRARKGIEDKVVVAQPGKHRLITTKTPLDGHKKTDYLVHLHPALCLFDDVRFVSGEAFGKPELAFTLPDRPRAHAKHPGGGLPPANPGETPRDLSVRHGGATIGARANKALLADPARLRQSDHTRPIGEWLKTAVMLRLRKPGTLYEKDRLFMIQPPGVGLTAVKGPFPRKLGRRMDYDTPAGAGSDKGLFYTFPHEAWHDGDLLNFHGLVDAGKLCGGDKAPPAAGPPHGPALTAAELDHLAEIDDEYWPASFADMPLLRELAFTTLQYDRFKVWSEGKSDLRSGKLLDLIASRSLRATFAGAATADAHFASLLAASPKFATALIDLAHLGAMLGGSFLPGIEVGREGGILRNWTLFVGATDSFPTIRFKPSDTPAEHTAGTLTKDLAIPWSQDFEACNETYWPTSRPGVTTTGGARHKWISNSGVRLPHLSRVAVDDVEYLKEYWKALGFIRRTATDEFHEAEQTWH